MKFCYYKKNLKKIIEILFYIFTIKINKKVPSNEKIENCDFFFFTLICVSVLNILMLGSGDPDHEVIVN